MGAQTSLITAAAHLRFDTRTQLIAVDRAKQIIMRAVEFKTCRHTHHIMFVGQHHDGNGFRYTIQT
jgi:uncharacterized protein (DUF1778 family)